MNGNRAVLVSAALLTAGLWVAWISIPGADAASSTATRPPDVEEASVPTPVAFLESEIAGSTASNRIELPRPRLAEQDAPILVAGLVVDATGAPVGGASVLVKEFDPSASERRLSGTGLHKTDASGRFEIRDVRASLRLVAWASKSGFVDSEAVSFVRGDKQLKLTLCDGGVVSGKILVDPGIPIGAIRLRLETMRDSRPLVPARRRESTVERIDDHQGKLADFRAAEDGSFTFEGIPATDARLVVALEEDPSPIFRVEAVRAHGIDESPDPRLDPLDLRGAIQKVTIQVEDDSGRELSGAVVVLGDPMGERHDRGKVTQLGSVSFLTAAGPFDLEVEYAGWRRSRILGAHGDQLIRLQQGIPVRIVVDGANGSPADPDGLAVGMLVDVDHPRSVLDGIGTLSAEGETRFLASSPGPHEIAWYLERGTTRHFLVGTPRRTVEVRDSDREQVIRLELTPDVRISWASTQARLAADGKRVEALDAEDE